MSEAAPADETPQIEVHALLVCREVVGGKTGGVSVREVLDIVPVLQLPGDAGPLTFAAFVRAHRAGEAKVHFRIYPLGDPSVTLIELPPQGIGARIKGKISEAFKKTDPNAPQAKIVQTIEAGAAPALAPEDLADQVKRFTRFVTCRN